MPSSKVYGILMILGPLGLIFIYIYFRSGIFKQSFTKKKNSRKNFFSFFFFTRKKIFKERFLKKKLFKIFFFQEMNFHKKVGKVLKKKVEKKNLKRR